MCKTLISVLASACAFLVALVKLCFARSGLWAAIAIVPLYMMLRELDWQSAFTSRTIAPTGFYFHPDIPLLTKLTVLAALSLLALAGCYLVRAGLPELLTTGGPKADWWQFASPFGDWAAPLQHLTTGLFRFVFIGVYSWSN
jgi:hypothetical protein